MGPSSTTTSSETTTSPTIPTSEPTTTSEITTSSAPTPSEATTSSPSTGSTVTTTTDGGPCPPDFGARPNCGIEPEGSVFPHPDCIKYWECEFGSASIKLCSPGTVFDGAISECNWQGNVDTTCCRIWDCALDNTYYPAEDCDKYYRCYNGEAHLEQCANCLFWNQGILECDIQNHVDSSLCDI